MFTGSNNMQIRRKLNLFEYFLGLNEPANTNNINLLCSIMFFCVIPTLVRTRGRKFIKVLLLKGNLWILSIYAMCFLIEFAVWLQPQINNSLRKKAQQFTDYCSMITG